MNIMENIKSTQENFSIVLYDEQYCDDVIRIGNEMFGDGYFSKEKIDFIQTHRNIFYVCLENDKAAGYCLFVEESIEEAEKLLKTEASEIKKYNGGDAPVCLIKSMAIDERYKLNGIARNLFKCCYDKCLEAGYHSAWGSAWKIGDRVAMQKIFDEFEFQSISEIPNIWYDDTGYTCVVCKGRCRCTGVIFVKSF